MRCENCNEEIQDGVVYSTSGCHHCWSGSRDDFLFVNIWCFEDLNQFKLVNKKFEFVKTLRSPDFVPDDGEYYIEDTDER